MPPACAMITQDITNVNYPAPHRVIAGIKSNCPTHWWKPGGHLPRPCWKGRCWLRKHNCYCYLFFFIFSETNLVLPSKETGFKAWVELVIRQLGNNAVLINLWFHVPTHCLRLWSVVPRSGIQRVIFAVWMAEDLELRCFTLRWLRGKKGVVFVQTQRHIKRPWAEASAARQHRWNSHGVIHHSLWSSSFVSHRVSLGQSASSVGSGQEGEKLQVG